MSDSICITLQDIIATFKEHRRALFLTSCICSISFFLGFLFFREPLYRAEASFRQAETKAEDSLSLRGLFKNLQIHKESDAITVMFSRKILTRVIGELGLQLSVQDSSLGHSMFLKAKRNLIREVGGIAHKTEGFAFNKVDSPKETSHAFFLLFSNATQFTVLNEEKQILAAGKLGEEIKIPDVTFTIERVPASLEIGKEYEVKVEPQEKIITKIVSSLEIRPNKLHPHFLSLIFQHEERSIAKLFLNKLMSTYQDYLSQQNEESILHQLSFLEKRRSHLSVQLKENMQDYATYLKKNLKENGIMGLSKQIELTAVPMETDYLEKLAALSLEKQHYEKKAEQRRSMQVTSLRPVLHPFQELNKKTAQELYLKYSQEWDSLQVKVSQLSHFLLQMAQPFFEVSSLSVVLTDSVSQDLMRKASEAALVLCDTVNRSDKDLQRAQEMLDVQKRFLGQHVTEMIHLEKIHIKLLEEKIFCLRKTVMTLIEEEEKQLLKELRSFREQVSHFPDKWLLENELEFEKKMHMKVIDSMTQLTESKIIQQLLFQVESKPLDEAYSPLKPQHPHLFLILLLGASSCFFLLFCFYFCKRMMITKRI